MKPEYFYAYPSNRDPSNKRTRLTFDLPAEQERLTKILAAARAANNDVIAYDYDLSEPDSVVLVGHVTVGRVNKAVATQYFIDNSDQSADDYVEEIIPNPDYL